MKKIIISMLTLIILIGSVAYAEEVPELDETEEISVTSPAVTEVVTSSASADEELPADEEPVIIVTYPEEETENGFTKPFSDYTPTDIFTFLILLIKIFENVIKLFIHQWGLPKW